MDITIQLSCDRDYQVLLLVKTICAITACLQTPLSDFRSAGSDITQAFEISLSTKLFSGSRRNVEEGCQDIKQLLVTSYPRESQFFLSPYAKNVVYLALEVMQCV